MARVYGPACTVLLREALFAEQRSESMTGTTDTHRSTQILADSSEISDKESVRIGVHLWFKISTSKLPIVQYLKVRGCEM
jgi:hypothetical protein